MVSVPEGMPRRKIRITAGHHEVQDRPNQAQQAHRLIPTVMPQGLPEDPADVFDELEGYIQVLLGHADPPVDSPYLALQEVATAYLSRAYEISILINRGETEGRIKRGSTYYLLRTRSLRDFIEMARKLADLGSRRLSQEVLLTQQRRDSGEH